MYDGEFEDDAVGGIDDLIRYHQREMERMKVRVKQATDDHEFEEARAFDNEFFRHESKLRLLRDLSDPTFDRRASLYRRLVRLEEKLQENSHLPQYAAQCKQQLKEINDELDKLESRKYAPLETQYIDDALFELVQGNIQGFSIVLNKREGIVIQFYCKENLLFVHFLYSKGSIGKFDKRHLRSLGFLKTEEKRNYVREFDVRLFYDAQPVKQILSAILFEMLGRGRFDNPTELIIDVGSDGESGDSDV
ncbi:hypothetical protein WBG78_07105 [Chryseolinea sp. T2]|uniref:hypothetical protein n=1 Tax=Chryseolinea sp. T2 TaxID=3129255 RepID=UPI003076A5F8